MRVSTTLLLLSKALDQLDGNALDETQMGEWAASQMAEVSRKGFPEAERREQLSFIKRQVDEAITSFAKGDKFFTPKALPAVKAPATPLATAKAALTKQLEETGTTPAAASTETAATPAAETAGAGEETDKPDETADAAATEPAAKGKTKGKTKPQRKAAPAEIGQHFFEADEDDPWPDAIGGTMKDIAIGPGGAVYNRQH